MEGARAVTESGKGGADIGPMPPEQALKRIKKLEAEMMKLARNLEFEQAARLRDKIQKLRQAALGVPSTMTG
jgi:excinuclease ABC subunit B